MRPVAFAVLVSAAAWSVSAAAFTVDGHDAVEAAAYRRLVGNPAVADGRGGTVSGTAAVAYLMRRGFLARPRCFESTDVAAVRRCAKEAEERPLVTWPELLSGAADLVSARQLSTNGQCFHFMAPTEYAWTTPRDPRTGFAVGFAQDAYERCTRALGELFDETLRDPAGSNRENRGLYALMHAFADSFSAAHVERDARWRVLYLKPWRLRGLVSYARPDHWDGFRYVFGESHHSVIDGRDDAFVDDESERCKDYKQAYALPEGCLTPRGDRAARAVVDLLVTVYGLARQADAGLATDPRAGFLGLVARHLESVYAQPDVRAPFWRERDWSAAYVFGFRERPRPVPGANDLSVVAGAGLFSDVTFPFVPFASAEVGCRRLLGRCKLELGVDPVTLLLPITDDLAIGATPLSIVGSPGAPDALSVGANVVRADLYLLDAAWLSVAGPRYSWVHQRFDAEPLAVSFGFAWDGKFAAPRSVAGLGEHPARAQADARDIDATPKGGTWRPAPLGRSYKLGATTKVIHVVGGTLLTDAQQGAYSVGGLEVLFDRDRWGRRAGFALGGRLDTEFRPTAEGDHWGGLGGPVARVYVWPNRVAIEAQPALVDAGYVHRTGREGEGAIDVDLGGAVAIVPFGHVEIELDTPRLSYRTGSRVPGTNLGLRFGLALE